MTDTRPDRPDQQRLAGPLATSNDITPGPFSEYGLRKAWNLQADQFNQWDSLATCEQLAFAQTRAIAADRARRAADGEVGELVRLLKSVSGDYDDDSCPPSLESQQILRAAELLQEQAAELAMLRQERPNG